MALAVARKSDNMVVNLYNLPFKTDSAHIITAVQYLISDITFGSTVQLLSVPDGTTVGTVISNVIIATDAGQAQPG